MIAAQSLLLHECCMTAIHLTTHAGRGSCSRGPSCSPGIFMFLIDSSLASRHKCACEQVANQAEILSNLPRRRSAWKCEHVRNIRQDIALHRKFSRARTPNPGKLFLDGAQCQAMLEAPPEQQRYAEHATSSAHSNVPCTSWKAKLHCAQISRRTCC